MSKQFSIALTRKTMMGKAMFERGIRFCVFVRDESDVRRIERVFGCKFVKYFF